jgi:hypothetical protein
MHATHFMHATTPASGSNLAHGYISMMCMAPAPLLVLCVLDVPQLHLGKQRQADITCYLCCLSCRG